MNRLAIAGTTALVLGILGFGFDGVSQVVAGATAAVTGFLTFCFCVSATKDGATRFKFNVDGTVLYADITDKAMAAKLASCAPFTVSMANEDGHVMRYYADCSLTSDNATTNGASVTQASPTVTDVAVTTAAKPMAQVGDMLYRPSDNSLAIVYKNGTPVGADRVVGHIEGDGVLLLMDNPGSSVTVDAAQ